jgi:hypothetical protein
MLVTEKAIMLGVETAVSTASSVAYSCMVTVRGRLQSARPRLPGIHSALRAAHLVRYLWSTPEICSLDRFLLGEGDIILEQSLRSPG